MAGSKIRRAVAVDIPALLRLEQASFAGDRLGRRNFRWMLGRAHGLLLLAGEPDELLGYVLVLFRRGSRRARIYSIAVAPAARGSGLAAELLLAAESAARSAGCTHMRLEVRPDNPAAQRFYAREGYREFGRRAGFYEDGAEALRLEKALT